jgi:YD repeat-containing protein
MGWKNGNSAKRYFTLTQEKGQPWVKTWYVNTGRITTVETVGPKGMSISKTNTYNSKGLLTQTENRQGSITLTESYAYDDRGRITASACDTWLRRTTYSYANRQVTTTRHTNTALNNDGRIYTETYDAWGNIKSSGDPVSNVTYTYSSNGKPKTITAGGVTTSMTYDAAGNQKTLADPDAGTTTYTCDALGRVTAQVDARGKQSTTEYAAVGRMLYNTVDGVRTTYTYGSSGYNMQRLTGMEAASSYANYAYDKYGRLSSEVRHVAPDEHLSFTYAYTPQGQLKSITYPGGLQVTQEYDAYGNHVKTLAGTQTVWELTGETGLTTTAQLGGGAMTATTTRNSKGWLAGLKTVKGSATIRDLGYIFDGATDNLIYRTGMIDQQEAFYYDGSNRLTTVQHGTPAVTAMSVSYAANGNISSKTGVGQYAYLPGKPHAVEYVDNTDGLISGNDQSIAYTAFGKASSITEMAGADSYGLEFTYGPDRQRWKTVLKKNGVAQKTTIFAGDYEKITENGVARQLYYLHGADGLAAVYVKQAGQADKIYGGDVKSMLL